MDVRNNLTRSFLCLCLLSAMEKESLCIVSSFLQGGNDLAALVGAPKYQALAVNVGSGGRFGNQVWLFIIVLVAVLAFVHVSSWFRIVDVPSMVAAVVVVKARGTRKVANDLVFLLLLVCHQHRHSVSTTTTTTTTKR
jgi:hypothetical protein